MPLPLLLNIAIFTSMKPGGNSQSKMGASTPFFSQFKIIFYFKEDLLRKFPFLSWSRRCV